MVNNYAVIEDGVVTNTAIAEVSFAIEQGWVLLTNGATIGWLYDPVTGFSLPPPPADPTQEEQSENRAEAYRTESDPIFFMAQRGEATMDEWLAKVEEIKARYPYPKV